MRSASPVMAVRVSTVVSMVEYGRPQQLDAAPRARHLLLGRLVTQGPDRHDVAGPLLGADDEGAARPGAVGLLELRFERAAIVGAPGREPGPAQLAARTRAWSPPVTSTTKASGLGRSHGEHALGVTGQEEALDADAEADAGGRVPAQASARPS